MAHLEWEKRCFDPDDDGLYENVANTFISDAHHYSGGPCTQASAYNYRALAMTARLARLIGKNPEPFEREAKKTLAAMNRVLWMPDRGWFAEYRDLLGLQRLHPSAELPSVYHPIDSFVPDPFQAWQMLRYVDTAIEHIPVDGSATMLWSSNWVPFIWSVRDVCGVEVAHTALANWQAGRPQKAYDLWRGAIIDSMFCCRAPGACIGTSELDGHMTGLCTDFADTVGMYNPIVRGRALWNRAGRPCRRAADPPGIAERLARGVHRYARRWLHLRPTGPIRVLRSAQSVPASDAPAAAGRGPIGRGCPGDRQRAAGGVEEHGVGG